MHRYRFAQSGVVPESNAECDVAVVYVRIYIKECSDLRLLLTNFTSNIKKKTLWISFNHINFSKLYYNHT